ncbi:MAG TPA: hypothetical protein GXX75_00740 [Clostridiales bacterium]|nr:hypothetical protein [Clostridiales bacterium]
MNHTYTVFRIQYALFKREKGMALFYLLSIALIGIIAPVFLHSVGSSLIMAALVTIIFLKPIISDSLAGEREQRTLEPLLSTSIKGKSILWGKAQFCLLFAVGFFTMAVVCAVLVNRIAGYRLPLQLWQWIGIVLLIVPGFSAITITGIYASAMSENLRIAGSRVSRISYPLGLLLVVYFSVVFTGQFMPTLMTGFALITVYLCIIIRYAVKVSRMEQSNYFEEIKRSGKPYESPVSYGASKSQFGIVFRYEMKYVLTLKILMINFLGLCFAPVAMVCLLAYYTGEINLNYAVLITILMIPRVPTNLIAYSIGGEKVYKTGESLLATPLRTRAIFVAKCMVPILISLLMLILSSSLTLAGANILRGFIPIAAKSYIYNAEQLVLLFPVGMMSCTIMVFMAGILSVVMKTPRQGLYASSLLGAVFVVPALAIVYLAQNRLLWSGMYFAVLLAGSVLCLKCISGKISRPQIMGKL